MNISNKILSDITVYMKYAKYIPELNRRETWEELVTRNKKMHLKKDLPFAPVRPQARFTSTHEVLAASVQFFFFFFFLTAWKLKPALTKLRFIVDHQPNSSISS